MGLHSKEEQVLELFLNEPTKQWHFSKIVKVASVSEPIANKWLQNLIAENIIKRVKPKSKMPFYISNFRHDNYRNKKRLYALQKLYETGLLSSLQSLRQAKVIVIFGSFARSDWNSNSDVDIFILGNPGDFRFGMLWSGLGFQAKSRELQVHSYSSLERIQQNLLNNIVKGYFVKGYIHDIVKVG